MKHQGPLGLLPLLEILEPRLLLDATPSVLSVSINDGAAQRATIQSVSISFDKDVSASLIPGELVLHNNTTGADVIISGATVSFDHGWDIARWDLSHTPIPDGNYTATLPAGSVADPLGNALANDYKLSFYKYYGDNDGTRATDTTDLFALRDTYLKSSGDAGYSAAFDSDGDGDVDSADLFQFRSNYTHSLAAPTTNLLMVDNGNGDGQYSPNATVTITAAAAPPGKVFNMWVGDIPISTVIGSATAATTTYKMPAGAARLIATYRDVVFSLDDSTDWLPKTQAFDNQTFGAEKEPLAYQIFGNTLAFQADGEYKYASETSAFLAFETNLPARTYIEYGTTTSYGQYSQQLDRYNYLHNYNLTGLSNGTTYHYRFVAQDERGNILTSPDKTLTTATPANVIYVPGGHFTSAYTCSQSGKTYLLTGDVTADGFAFKITANNITLDLGGHKVVYNNTDYQVPDSTSYGDWPLLAPDGVYTSYALSGIKVYNGFIKQGLGYGHASVDSTGYSPVQMWGCTSSEVTGITAEWGGGQATGMDLGRGVTARFNTLLDHGVFMSDRMKTVSAVYGSTAANHNLVLRGRQFGVTAANGSSNDIFYDNEIYIDSVCTNSFAVNYYNINGGHIYGNRIFGTGYLMVGIGTVSLTKNVEVNNNFIHLQGGEPDARWPEYGPWSGVNGVRLTWGASNITYHDNVISVYARDGGAPRGIWMYTQSSMSNILFKNNTVQAIFQNAASTVTGAVCVPGDGSAAGISTVYATFQNNRIISNLYNVVLGEDYGNGTNTLFLNNTFVKSPLYPRPECATILIGYYQGSVSNHQFFDSTFEGGASYNAVTWGGNSYPGLRNFYVGWTLTVQTTPGATVTIKDSTNATVFTGTADANGIATTRLYQYRDQKSASNVYSRTFYTPDTVTISKTGYTTKATTITMDATKTLTLLL